MSTSIGEIPNCKSTEPDAPKQFLFWRFQALRNAYLPFDQAQIRAQTKRILNLMRLQLCQRYSKKALAQMARAAFPNLAKEFRLVCAKYDLLASLSCPES